MKLSIEERIERKRVYDKRYRLNNTEELKLKRKEYLKKRLQDLTDEQKESRRKSLNEYNKRYLQNLSEEKKEKRREKVNEYNKRYLQNLPVEQKKKRRIDIKRRFQNRTEE